VSRLERRTSVQPPPSVRISQ
jgi:hypothetical protein